MTATPNSTSAEVARVLRSRAGPRFAASSAGRPTSRTQRSPIVTTEIRSRSEIATTVALAAATVGVVYGYDTGSIAGAQLFIPAQFHLSNSVSSGSRHSLAWPDRRRNWRCRQPDRGSLRPQGRDRDRRRRLHRVRHPARSSTGHRVARRDALSARGQHRHLDRRGSGSGSRPSPARSFGSRCFGSPTPRGGT